MFHKPKEAISAKLYIFSLTLWREFRFLYLKRQIILRIICVSLRNFQKCCILIIHNICINILYFGTTWQIISSDLLKNNNIFANCAGYGPSDLNRLPLLKGAKLCLKLTSDKFSRIFGNDIFPDWRNLFSQIFGNFFVSSC